MHESESDLAKRWHVDKRIPVALIVTFFTLSVGQLVVGTAWVSGVSRDIATLKEDSARMSKAIADLSRLETRVAELATDVKHIQKTLDRLVEVAPQPRRPIYIRPKTGQ
jgi:outer membrane murein-binding lipoprotein Lpp